MSKPERSFQLKPVSITEEEAQLLYSILAKKDTMGSKDSLEILHSLIQKGLIIFNDLDIELTEVGKGLLELLPEVVRSGTCCNCGKGQGVLGERAISLMFSQPGETCDVCGTKLFEEKKCIVKI